MALTILWDNDGVLVDTERLYFQASREILASADVDLTREKFVSASMTRGASVFDLLEDGAADNARIGQLRTRRNERYMQLIYEEDSTIDGAAATLASLAGRVGMGIVTGSHRDHFDAIHREGELLKYMDFVFTREDYDRGKPCPDAYLHALDTCGLAANQCLVIEDSPRGFEAAKAAGIRCVVVPNDLTRGHAFDGAYALLERIDQVVDLVDRMLQL